MEPCGLVLDQVLDVFVAGERAGGIVGRADIEESGIGRGGEHGLYVMRPGLGERNANDTRTHGLGGSRSGFVAGFGGDEGRLGRSESRNRVVQSRRRAGERHDGLRLESLLFGEGLDQFLGEVEVVAPAFGGDRDNGLARSGARPQRVLVGVDAHGACGKVDLSASHLSQQGLAQHAVGQRGGGSLQEIATGKGRTNLVVCHRVPR